jgi:hypothetical protein
MADSVEEMAKAGTWTFLASATREFVGELRLQDLLLDTTRREAIDTHVLDGLLPSP